MNKISILFLTLILGAVACKQVRVSNLENSKGVIEEHAMVVSAHPLATQVGVDILQKGGNAIDAAIAVQYALAVVYPAAGNIGGGGFMVIRKANGEVFTLDYREKLLKRQTGICIWMKMAMLFRT